MTARRAALIRLSAAMISAALVGCHPQRDARPPLATPAVQVRVDHFAGTALSGPQATAPADLSNAWGVSAHVIAIASTTPGGFARVGSSARLVLGPETGAVVSPSARLIYSTLIRSLAPGDALALGDAADQASLGTPAAALVAGATASIAVTLPDGTPMTADCPRRAVRVELSRRATGDAYDVAIVSDDLANVAPPQQPIVRHRATASVPREPPAPTPSSSSSTTTASEVLVLQRTLVAGVDRFALAIPMTFPRSPARSVVVELTVGAKPSGATLATMRTQLEKSAADVVASRASATPSADELAIGRALDALGAAGASPRGTLTFIAGRTGAHLAEAVALVADDSLLQLIAGQAQARLAHLASHDGRSVAWLLDRTTIDALASVTEADAPRVLPPIQGALSVYAGEAGRQLDVLHSLAGEASSDADLYERIVAENTILLEESSPGLRVRAYDWLRAAGRAPAGFDPLGTPQRRRAALEGSRGTTLPATIPTSTP